MSHGFPLLLMLLIPQVLGVRQSEDLTTELSMSGPESGETKDKLTGPDGKGLEIESKAGLETDAADEGTSQNDGPEPVTVSWQDDDHTVRVVETKCGIDFITHIFKGALHAPPHLKEKANEYMSQIIGEDWIAKVSDPEFKPNAKQKGKQFSRMFAVKLSNNKGVLLYSPISVDAPGALEAVQEMGEVTVIILPNKAHYMKAYGWQLKYPQASIWGVKSFSATKKCRWASGKMFNPVACAAGGEAPVELGGFSGPGAMWAGTDYMIVDRWSTTSIVPLGLFGIGEGAPAHLDEDFIIYSFEGEKLTKEFLFYHKKSKILLTADWLYTGTKLSLADEWNWSPEAKLFSLIMGYQSPAPALPLYRAFKSGVSTVGLFSAFAKPPASDEGDIFAKARHEDDVGAHTAARAANMVMDWKQMKKVRDQILALDLKKILIVHSAGFPEGDFAKEIINAHWGFLTNNMYCCCKEGPCPDGTVSDDGITQAKTATFPVENESKTMCCKGKDTTCDAWRLTDRDYTTFAPDTSHCQ